MAADVPRADELAMMDGSEPLLLDSTHVEVTLLPPLAHVVIVRHFTNTSDRVVEAELTLPPLAPGEVVYRLIVNLGGIECQATPKPADHARQAHEAALTKGRPSILYELLDGAMQRIAIAGIDRDAVVEVQIWSIRPLDRSGESMATLSIPLGIDPGMPCPGLSAVDAPNTTPTHHPATLSINPESLDIRLVAPNAAPLRINSRSPVSVDCAAAIGLEIAPRDGATLDRSEWRVGKPGGWEATSPNGTETFRHPLNLPGCVASDRDD